MGQFQDPTDYTFRTSDGNETTFSAYDLDTALCQAPPNSELIKVNGDTRFQTIHKLTQDPLQKGSFCVYNVFMFNPNTTFNPAFPYAVVCAAAPHENTVFKTLDECWGLCLDLSEEYGHSEIWYGKCLMGEYRNGQ